MNTNWIPGRDEVVEATKAEIANNHTRMNYRNIRGFYYHPRDLHSPVWVKYIYDDETTGLVNAEARTQMYVWNAIQKADQQTRQGFYVPQIFDVFHAEINGFDYGLIVMEYITGTPMHEIIRNIQSGYGPIGDSSRTHLRSFDELMNPKPRSDDEVENSEMMIKLYKDKIVGFVSFLLLLHPTSKISLGPHGGGLIINHVFGYDDPEAPREFSDVKDLEDYMNDVIQADRFVQQLTVNLESDGLRLCCCDLNFGNFLMKDPSDPLSQMIIIDFEHTSWLPHSLLMWALRADIARQAQDTYLMYSIMFQGHLTVNEDNIQAIHQFSRAYKRATGAT